MTYFAPWIEETFPASIDDMALLKLFDAKKGPLNRTDIQDILKVKDLFNFGQTIMDLLLGKISRKYNTNAPSSEYYQLYSLESIPEVWSTRPELAGIIEIINSCF